LAGWWSAKEPTFPFGVEQVEAVEKKEAYVKLCISHRTKQEELTRLKATSEGYQRGKTSKTDCKIPKKISETEI
jgi:hypothetical protein